MKDFSKNVDEQGLIDKCQKFDRVGRLIVLNLFIILLSANISGLSCAGFEPQVSALDSTSSDNIEISGSQAFNSSKVRQDEYYSISKYEEIALNALDSIKKNSSQNYRIKVLERSIVNKSDAMVFGPPTRSCNYGFKGFVDTQEGMQAAVVDGSFERYKYRDTVISTSPGKNITCETVEDPACTVSVNFQIGDEKFTIRPNQTYRPESKIIESIEVLNARKNFEWEWNTETYSHYIIYFSQEKSQKNEDNEQSKSIGSYIKNNILPLFKALLR